MTTNNQRRSPSMRLGVVAAALLALGSPVRANQTVKQDGVNLNLSDQERSKEGSFQGADEDLELHRRLPINVKLLPYLYDADLNYPAENYVPGKCSTAEKRRRKEILVQYTKRVLNLPFTIRYHYLFERIPIASIRSMASAGLPEAIYLLILVDSAPILDLCTSLFRDKIRNIAEDGLPEAGAVAGAIAIDCGDRDEAYRLWSKAYLAGKLYLSENISRLDKIAIEEGIKKRFESEERRRQ